MSEAIFGLIGVAIGAVVSYFAQIRATRIAIEAELKRLPIESAIRDEEKKVDMIRQCAAELLASADPELNPKADYRNIVVNIHRLQLLLDTRSRKRHGELNNAVNKLGVYFHTQQRSVDDLFTVMAQITEAVQHINEDGPNKASQVTSQ